MMQDEPYGTYLLNPKYRWTELDTREANANTPRAIANKKTVAKLKGLEGDDDAMSQVTDDLEDLDQTGKDMYSHYQEKKENPWDKFPRKDTAAQDIDRPTTVRLGQKPAAGRPTSDYVMMRLSGEGSSVRLASAGAVPVQPGPITYHNRCKHCSSIWRPPQPENGICSKCNVAVEIIEEPFPHQDERSFPHPSDVGLEVEDLGLTKSRRSGKARNVAQKTRQLMDQVEEEVQLTTAAKDHISQRLSTFAPPLPTTDYNENRPHRPDDRRDTGGASSSSASGPPPYKASPRQPTDQQTTRPSTKPAPPKSPTTTTSNDSRKNKSQATSVRTETCQRTSEATTRVARTKG